jgi:polyisoprenoid-binding protein YceI
MHGVTKEISFPFTTTGRVVNPADQTVRYGFNATLQVNRRDYGVNYTNKSDPTFVGDLVTVNLSLLTRGAKVPQ